MDAAIPGRRGAPTSTEQYNAHPGGSRMLACPNCGANDRLQLIETVDIASQADFVDVGVTDPEVVLMEDDDGQPLPFEVIPGRRKTIGWRCSNCSMSVQAADALRRLQ